MGLKDMLKNNYYVYILYDAIRYRLPYLIMGERQRDTYLISKKYKLTFGKAPNLKNPETLNEKIQWLKLNDHKPFHTICADKLAVREFWKSFGEEHLIPSFFYTHNWKEITYDKLPDVPCIVKCNTGCGCYEIIRDKNGIDIKELQQKCRRWLVSNYYYRSQEWQYKNIKPCIIVEKLLLDKNGHIPNDYKLHFINGELQFVYCSIDREGKNYRSIYSPSWERMDMEWVGRNDHKGMIGDDIPCPETFKDMVAIGVQVAQRFKYVRVDFYDVDGKLYYGEITLHHGSGYDTFEPEEWDLYYGKKLKLF